jgi:hypothetical protein
MPAIMKFRNQLTQSHGQNFSRRLGGSQLELK